MRQDLNLRILFSQLYIDGLRSCAGELLHLISFSKMCPGWSGVRCSQGKSVSLLWLKESMSFGERSRIPC